MPQRVWNIAKKTASKQYRNTQSKIHKQMEFAMAPSVLVVYVGGKKKAKRLREQLINK